jgi:gas vesicle protein
MGRMTERDMRAVGLGMALGAIVGAAVALLLAPKRGTELRDDLVRSAARVRRTVARSVTDAGSTASSVLERARPVVAAVLKPAGAGRADDSADLRERSRDMVAEGGPDEA